MDAKNELTIIQQQPDSCVVTSSQKRSLHDTDDNLHQPGPSNAKKIKRLFSGSIEAQNKSVIEIHEYPKRPGAANIHGHLYETKLAMLLLFRALNDKKIESFFLGTNVKDVGALDDIIIKCNEREKSRVIFIQTKHREDPERDPVTVKKVLKRKGDFSLAKYLKSYQDIKKRFNRTEDNDPLFRKDASENMEYVIFTNAHGNLLGKENYTEIVEPDPFLNTSEKGKTFKFHNDNEDINKELLMHSDINSVNNFLSKLRYYTNQLNEVDLEEFLKVEICEHCKRYTDSFIRVKIDAIFQTVHDSVQKWWKKKQSASYLTESCNFFEEAEKKILHAPLLTVLNWIYINKLYYFAGLKGIEFNEDAIQALELDKFISKHNELILNIITAESTLSNFKLEQYFRNSTSNHTFLDLDYVLKIDSYEAVISEFREVTEGILIIGCKECYTTDVRVEKFYNELKSILENATRGTKKVIFVTKANDTFAKKFQNDFYENYAENVDNMNNLINLTTDTQKILLQKNCCTQGQETTLNMFIKENSKYLIHEKILAEIISKEEIKVGEFLTNPRYNTVREYYISRNFDLKVLIKTEFMNYFEVDKEKLMENKLLVIINSKIIHANLQDEDLILISNIGEEFKDLCDKYKEHNIHWFKREGHGEFAWQKSCGSLENLRACVERIEESTKLTEKNIFGVDQNVVIIAAESGAGKSTVLTHLAVKNKKKDPSLCIKKINLSDYSTALRKRSTEGIKFDKIEVVKFLYETELTSTLDLIIENDKISLKSDSEKINSLDLLEIKLFIYYFNQGKVIFMFDGFDEICPDFKNKGIELLKFLKCTNRSGKIYVTTRPYSFLNLLEDELSVFSYILIPLTEEDQRTFFENVWKRNLGFDKLDINRLNTFTDEFLERFFPSVNSEKKDFIGIALHLTMMAEKFKDEFKEFYCSEMQEISHEQKERIGEKLDLVSLYNYFIDKKICDIRFGEKKPGMNADNSDVNYFILKNRKTIIKEHKLLAVYTIFNKEELKKLFPKVKMSKILKLIENVERGEEKTGLIERVINNKPSFIHLTFAEYFSASFLWQRFKSCDNDFIKIFVENMVEILIESDKIQICEFLQLIAQKDLETESSEAFIDKQGRLNHLFKEIIGKTCMHYALERNKQSTKLLLKIIEYYLSIKQGNDLEVIKSIQNLDGQKQLILCSVAAEMGYIKLVNVLSDIFNESKKMFHMYVSDDKMLEKWYDSPVWLSAENGHLDVLQVVNEKFYNRNLKDKDKMTLLQRVYGRKAFNVLRSCLKLDMFDVSTTFLDDPMNNIETMPLPTFMLYRAPLDVVELLIEKTNIDFINNSKEKFNYLPAATYVVGSLVAYEHLFNPLVKKGINLNSGIFTDDCDTPLNALVDDFFLYVSKIPMYPPNRWINLRRLCIFQCEEDFLNTSNIVKLLLEHGSIYNPTKEYGYTPLQLIQGVFYQQELLRKINLLVQNGHYKIDEILDEVILEISDLRIQNHTRLTSLKASRIESVKNREQHEHCIMKYKCTEILELLTKYVKDFFEFIYSTESQKFFDNIQLSQKDLESYKNEIKKTDWKTQGYTVEDIICMLKIEDINKKEGLLRRMLQLYVELNYSIDEAYAEVLGEASKLRKIYSYMEILNRGEGHICQVRNPELHDLILEVASCEDIKLSYLNKVGKKNLTKVLKDLLQYSEETSILYKLLKVIDDLFVAVKSGNSEKLCSAIEEAKKSGYSIADVVANVRDTEGTLKYHAGKNDNNEITKILSNY